MQKGENSAQDAKFVPIFLSQKMFLSANISSTAQSKAGRGRESMICQIRPDFSKVYKWKLTGRPAVCVTTSTFPLYDVLDHTNHTFSESS